MLAAAQVTTPKWGVKTLAEKQLQTHRRGRRWLDLEANQPPTTKMDQTPTKLYLARRSSGTTTKEV
ncbi:hypothetical protein TSUD_223730 [Trifolium subterraneum]|uniref:Uncharacterized protein n=1 Tax=Trifolium subterraneum TaxID=3900 RepID=A0A2Z6NJA5_TRISU|nr:hypothetical protein TSUD_223730 [Trifolium subterraneum]